MAVAIMAVLIYAINEKPWQNNSQNSDRSDYSESRSVDCQSCHGDGVCYHCNGDGFRNGRRCSVCDGAGECSKCGGAGILKVIVKNGKDYIQCTACHGGGECGACGGTGQIGYQSSSLGYIGGECSLCHGSGTCLSCKGDGLVRLKGF